MFGRLEQEKLQCVLDELGIEHTIGWTNYCGTFSLPEAWVINVDSIENLQRIVETLYALKIKYTVAAGGADDPHSASYSIIPWAMGVKVIFHLRGEAFNGVAVDKEKMTATVGASVMVGKLDETLDENGVKLKNPQSLLPYATNTGLVAVGGHGDGTDKESAARNAIAFLIMLENGKIVTFDKSHPLFPILGPAHLGHLGIVLETTYECDPAVKLRYRKIPMSLPALLRNIPNYIELGDHFRFGYFPTGENDLENEEILNAFIIVMYEEDLNVDDENFHPDFEYVKQNLQVNIQQGLHITDLFPYCSVEFIRAYMQYFVLPNAVGDKEVNRVGPYPGVYHDVEAYPPRLQNFDMPFQYSPGAAEVVAVLKEAARTHQEAIKNGEHPVTYAMFGRALAGALETEEHKGIESTAHQLGTKTFEFDVASSTGAPGFPAFAKHMIHYTHTNVGGRLHLTKELPLDGTVDYLKMFPGLPNYVKGMETWYEENKLDFKTSLLLTDFWRQFLYDPSCKQKLKQQQPATLARYKLAKYAKHHLAQLEGEDGCEELAIMKKYLEIMSNPSLMGLAINTMFKVAHDIGKSDLLAEPTREKDFLEGPACNLF